MPTPREQGGRLSEASRLLQEGLELLDQRTREVDALVQRAEERARQVAAEAEQRAHEITAEAERQRSELEEQVAALRAEVAAAREELAALSGAPGAADPPKPVEDDATKADSAGLAGAAAATGAAAASAAATALGAEEAEYVRAAEPTAGISEADAAEIAAASQAAPRWGRPSSIAAAQQAIRTRSARPRWIPPWFPFLLVMLVAAAVVATTVDGQVGPRGSPAESTSLAETPLPASPTADELKLTATQLAPSVFAVASVTPLTATQTPTITATPQSAAGSPTARPSVTVPLARASLTVPAALPAPVSPEGPIVAAYTTYSTYTVQPGDTLNRIASQFDVAGDVIIRTSNIGDPNLLVPGQVLAIPRDSGWLYRMQPGDTLDLIAVRFGVSIDDLVQASGLTSPTVRPGDLLFIPNKALPLQKQ
jgi:LysM repeat protein